MGKPGGHGGKKGKKVRVAFRRNRTKPARRNDWTEQAHQADGHEIDAQHSESVVPKGELSRQRTVKADEDKEPPSDLQHGVVLAMRGLYADVDDGDRIWPCTVRRVLRTRLIEQRHPVTVGDRVGFRVDPAEDDRAGEGVIEWVRPRQGELCRRVGRRIHTIVANVDQAIIVSSAGQPDPRPNLIDRYIVASLAGRITPVVCMNKIDLDQAGCAASLLKVYAELGYEALVTSAIEGTGITELRGVLAGKASVVVGQSGVGKSSLLNMVQPGLQLRTGEISEQVNKGRHVTTTASLIRLEIGGFVVDTPGIRSFDLSTVPRSQYELHFAEFVEHVAHCKFPDCSHTHEADCAVKAAVETGRISQDRYESYVRLFEDSSDPIS